MKTKWSIVILLAALAGSFYLYRTGTEETDLVPPTEEKTPETVIISDLSEKDLVNFTENSTIHLRALFPIQPQPISGKRQA